MSSRAVLITRSRWLAVMALIVAVGGAELYVSWLALHPRVSANYRAYYIDETTTCLDKPIGGHYTLGETISFMADDQAAARRIRVCGWDGPAGDGTHSVGTISRLRFAISEPLVDHLILQFHLAAITAPDHRSQRIVLTGNGVPIGEATIPDSVETTVEFQVPRAALEQHFGWLDVEVDYPTATEMTPRDSNTHYRSIKLMSVQLRRPEDPVSGGPQDDPVAQRYHAGPD